MSTRSYIGYELNGFITFKYNHFDGYVHGGVGETLVKHYNSFELAQAVTDIGNGSALHDTLEETKNSLYNDSDDCKAQTVPQEVFFAKDFWADNYSIEYVYIFKDGEWQFFEPYEAKRKGKITLKSVEERLAEPEYPDEEYLEDEE